LCCDLQQIFPRVKTLFWRRATRSPAPFSRDHGVRMALMLSFAVLEPNPEWRFMSIEEGRNYYRHMIETVAKEAKARR